jgi:flagellar export protein FliJ
MAKFSFKLEGVLHHRRNIEQQRQRELALVQAQMQNLQSELRQLDQSTQQAMADLRRTRLVGSIDMEFITAHRRFMGSMQRKAMALVQKMSLVQRQVDEARRALAEAAKQRKIMEKLRETLHHRWLDALNKRETEELDEIGTQLAMRQLRERLVEEPIGGGR